MDWWQTVLIILASIVVGLLVGGLLSYLIARLLKMPFLKKRETIAVVEEQLQPTALDLRAGVENDRGKVRIAQFLKMPLLKKRETTAVVEEQLKPTASDLSAEVESNRRTATEPWTGKLLPFETSVWDTSGDKVHTLPANLREDLTQAYADMRLANSIVWLSTELGRRSENLDENYMKLCTDIAAKLKRITPLLKQSGD